MKKFKETLKLSLMTLALTTSATISVRADATEVVKPITNATTILTSVIAAVGVGVLAWGGFTLGTAIKAADPSGQHQGFLTIAGGSIMFGIGTVLTILQS